MQPLLRAAQAQSGPAACQSGGEMVDSFPLSENQKSLWFMQQVLPESAVYHIALAVSVLSAIDASALRQALQALVDRHGALRTVFTMNATGDLLQSVRSSGKAAFEVIDTTGLSKEDIDAQVTAAYRGPLDLGTGPLFRSHLFTDGGTGHILLVTVHHTVLDVVSLGIVFTELLELYESARLGSACALRPLKSNYREFVEWQSRMLRGPEGEAHLGFWRAQLEGAPAVLEFPTDRPRPLHPNGLGESVVFALDRELIGKLKALTEVRNCHLYDILAAAWHVLLYRYSGQSDILSGFVTGGRPQLRFARTTGLYSNTIVLRGRFDGDPPFSDFLRRRHEELAEALKHQDYPFPLIADTRTDSRVPGYMPLVQVLFNFYKMPRNSQLAELFITGHESEVVQAGSLTLKSYGLKQNDIEFDLMMEVSEEGKSCWGRIRFSINLFNRPTVERIARHYGNLLRGIAEDPSRTVSSLPLLSEGERAEVLSRWTSMRTDYPVDTTACHLFEAQVARTPERIAAVCGERRLIYAELNARAASLAAYLRGVGVEPGDLVGVCLERSVDMLVALLAVWKAGAAYVPLDPDFPKARLELIVEDAAPRTIITETALANLSAMVRPVDRWPASGDLAYVLYTSGSTGKPKGVEIPHSALANFLLSMSRRPGISQDDVLLAVTTFSFDIAGLELFLPLIVGATVVIAARETTLDGRQLAREIESRGVTVMQATPATWRMLIDSDWTGCPRLKALCGGEAWPPDLAAELLARVGSLWNMYGPTETTIWSSVHEVGPEDNPIPLGSPVDNTALYILDANLEPVPSGVAGELHIGGAGLARGYRNLPALTTARFIEDPFVPGGRMFKTGDICRCRDDGRIHFLGRLDDQVKVRGHRIEPGEVERALLRHSAVHQAAVVVNEQPGSSKRLVAYLVRPEIAEAASFPALREFLSSHLPDYMIPSAFVYLDSLPLTPNSKVDRKALRERAVVAPVEQHEYAAPRTPTEVKIAVLWAEMLKVPRVGVDDRFDELGGDSLSFALMTMRASDRLAIRIPVRLDAEMLTLAGFARVADRIASAHAPLAVDFSCRPEPMARTWQGQMLVKTCGIIMRSVAHVEVDGLENLPAGGPVILAANHISLFDFVILGSVLGNGRHLRITPTFIIADKWRWLARPYASQFGHTIYIRRGHGDIEALKAAREVLANNGSLAIAPEGRVTHGALSRAKPGIAYLACQTGAPVWPVAIFGHERIFEFWKKLRRVPVKIRIGKSFALRGADADFQRQADSIMKAIAELMPPDYHGVYSERP